MILRLPAWTAEIEPDNSFVPLYVVSNNVKDSQGVFETAGTYRA